MLKRLAALAVLAIVVVALRTAFQEDPVLDEGTPPAPEEQAESALEPELSPMAASSGGPGPRTPAQTASQGASLPAENAPTGATFQGKVTVYDIDGNVLSNTANGKLIATLGRDRTSMKIEVDVKSGEFALALGRGDGGTWLHPLKSEKDMRFLAGAEPEELLLKIRGCEAEDLGQLVLIEGTSSPSVLRDKLIPLDPEGTELHLRTIPPFTLHVVDAKNRSIQLKDVEVLDASRGRNYLIQGEDLSRAVMVRTQASPFPLTPSLDQARTSKVECLVRAPGFAWKTVGLNLSSGGERTVALESGGDLKILVQGDLPEKARLRLYPDGERWPASDLSIETDAELVLEGLETGSFTARLEVGSALRRPLVLAEQQVSIQAGSMADIILTPVPPDFPASVEVSGTFRLPVAWELQEAYVTIVRTSPPTGSPEERSHFQLSKLRPDPGSPGVYPFSFGKLVPGTYVASLSDVGQAWEVEVPTTGLTDLRLDVPPPVQVTVAVRDSATGEISELAQRLRWEPKFDGHRNSSRFAQAARDEATKRFRLTVPEGPVSVGASHRQLARNELTFEAKDGLEVELLVQRIALAKIVLQHEGRTIPWPEDYDFDHSCRHIDGEGKILMRGAGSTGARFTVSEPGRYRVTLPKVEGFLLPEPVEMELSPEEPREITVELRPES